VRGQLAQNTILSLFWQGSRILFLAVWVILMARLLGVKGYGIYAGIAGLATALGSFSGLGFSLIMYQETARNPATFGDLWKKTIVITTFSGSVFSIFYVLIGIFIFPATAFYTLIAIAISELIFYPIMTACAFAFASHSRIGWSSALPSIMASLRLFSLFAFSIFSAKKNIDDYVWYHATATFLTSALTVKMVYSILRPTKSEFCITCDQIYDGFKFCTSWAISNSLTSIDKTLALKLGGAEIAGLYGAAYRFVNILMQPIDALIGAAMPKLFVQGAQTNSPPNIIKYLFFVLVTYSIAASLIIFYLSFLISFVLGDSFSSATETIKWFALLIPCYAIRSLSSNILLASNKVNLRIIIESSGLLILIALGYSLIPTYGIAGATTMVILTEAILALISCAAIFKKSH
jgi:O-antigen/teichoic acid export membrane protein